MQPLKLLALDTDDLQVMSAHLQDAVLRVADIAYVPAEKRFAIIANRFDWEGVSDGKGGAKKDFQRRRSALRFDRVLGVQIQGVEQNAKNAVLELLAVQFEEADKPEGHVTLTFAGGRFQPNPWTYPDYRTARYRRFFEAVRAGLLGHIEAS